MKFGKQLAAQQVPVWASFYLDYKGLKKIINSLAKGRPADAALLAAGYRPPFRQQTDVDMPPAAEESAAELHAAVTVITRTSSGLLLESEGESDLLQAHRAAFFFKLERELEKINAFYLQKEAELKGRVRTLIDKRKNIQVHLGGTLSRSSAAFNALYDGLRYFERDLSKLQNYIEMNATGFRKILKKWDKRSKSSTKELYLARQVDVQPCFNRDVVSELSDTAAANVRKLENLCIPRGAEQTVDPAADGILSERKGDLAIADAEAQGDLLSNLESELTNAVRVSDLQGANAILANLPAPDTVDKEVRSQLMRTIWQAAFTSTTAEPVPFDTQYLNFSFIDDIDGRTPLMGAAAKGLLGLAELCMRSGADANRRDVYGRQALHYAAMANGAVCSFVAKQTEDVDAVDHDGQSALVCAIVHGKSDCVAILIKQANLATATASTSMLPLSLACKQGNVEIVSLLLQRGHTIACDASGSLPQHIAAKEGHVAVLDALVAAGADINAADKFANWTPLFHAANEGHMSCVSSLLRQGANMKLVDDQGKLAVHHAAWSGHPEIVTLLLQASPDIRPTRINSPANILQGPGAIDGSDMDPDGIPDLSLPPPALPLRTYGHSYLDNKRNLLQLVFGHPATSKASVLPVQFYRQDQMTSLRLVVSSPQDSFGAPHTLNLPITDDRDSISLFINDIDSFTLNIEVYPMFGSRIIGKTVCFAGQFANINSIGQLTFPLLDTHLAVIGSVNFEATYTRNFHDVQLAIGGRLETYWKSVTVTNSPPPSKSNGWKPSQSDSAGGGGGAAITASSLKGDYVKVVVQTTRDGVPYIYPRWTLPAELYDLMISNITSRQLDTLAVAHGRGLDRLPVGIFSTASQWHAALAEVVAPLSDALSHIPSTMGINIEIRYPTPSDCARLSLRDPPEVNTFIDAILAVVYANTLTKDGKLRRILFSSFSPAACTALNWKQPNYAVLFASYCGLSRSTPEGQLNPPHRKELDKRCTSIEGAVKFAKANNLLGVLLEAAIVSQVPSLIDSIKENGLLLALFGNGARSLSDVDAVSLSEGVLTAKATV